MFLTTLQKKGKVANFEARLKRKDGSIWWASTNAHFFKDGDGNILGVEGISRDITELKSAEEALKESEEKYRHLFETAMVGMYRTRIEDGKFLAANQRLAKMMGYDSVERFVEEYATATHYTDPNRRDELLSRIQTQGWADGFEIEMVRTDGSTIQIALSATAYPDRGYLEGIVVDMTERKQIEEELRKSERRFRELAEMLPEALFEADINMKLTFVNQRALSLFGYSMQDFQNGLNGFDMLIPECREMALKNIARRFRGEKFPAIEYRALKKDGVTFPILLHASPIIDHGIDKGIRGVIIDITEHKKVENEIKKQKRLFETMFNTIPDGVVITNTRREIQLANKGMESTFGYKPDDLLGKTTEMLYANKDRFREAGAVVFDKNAKKQGDLYVTYYLDKTGKEFPGETFGAKLFDENNKWIGNLGIMRDITEREQAQKRIQQAQKMEALGTLSGGIAHDFNNILAAILGYAELGLMDVSRGLSNKERLEQILKSGLRAKNLVQQILSFSRRSDSARKPIQIASIIAETVKLLRATLPTTIEIVEEFEAEPDNVLADPTQIHQVLVNLCTNSAHAMGERGGVLKIRLERISLDERSAASHAELNPGAYSKLTVSDTGEGMDKDTVERIFEPFFTTKETGQGTGMGLAVVHGILKAHGGAITVNSEAGKGSTFQVYLPILEIEAEKEDSEETESVPLGTEHILFVDDEKTLADIGKQMLERLGYQVIARTSSLEALEVFRTKADSFHLVITDQTMPNMTGVDLTKEILRIRPDIPIIICTGFSAQISEKKAGDLGVRRVLMKPLVAREVAEAIREVLDETEA